MDVKLFKKLVGPFLPKWYRSPLANVALDLKMPTNGNPGRLLCDVRITGFQPMEDYVYYVQGGEAGSFPISHITEVRIRFLES